MNTGFHEGMGFEEYERVFNELAVSPGRLGCRDAYT
jgi:hypothetical protein